MQDTWEALRQAAERELAAAADAPALEAWRIEYLGRRGRLAQAMHGLGQLPPEVRPAAGAAGNAVKTALTAAYDARKQALADAEPAPVEAAATFDVTLPGIRPRLGQVHVINQVKAKVIDAFGQLGFRATDGPEVEWDRNNFTLLNLPEDHPARDMWDTFYVENVGKPGEVLLRTHTSPMQIRVMEQTEPPVRVIVPGKVYRYEATDATHGWMLYQVEGFAVDRRVTMADLKGTLTQAIQLIFGRERRTRFRCDYFPFVEPGVDMAMECHVCDGSGWRDKAPSELARGRKLGSRQCGVCSNTGWIEILGAGMIHPQVLRNVGYDPEEYSGFAFGMGLDRIAMLLYGIDDLRLFYENDLRFLRQFR